jgi:hypothetical protein
LASSNGESWRETSAQSSTVMVPSGRSAMICRVVPLRPEMATRTMRKPISLRVGSIKVAISAATPVSLTKRVSDTAPLTCLTFAAYLAMEPARSRGTPKEKERTLEGPLSELR